MSDDEYAYLQPGFDPSTLTVPRLRSVLVAHDVSYPSSAKKADLVELFNDNVAKNAKRIRSAQARTKRSSKGIVSVSPGGRAIDADHDEDAPEDDEVAPLKTPARKPSRKSMRAATEEAVGATPRTGRSKRQSTVPLSATKSSSRGADGLGHAQDALTVPKSRKSRHSISPAVKHESEEEQAQDDHASPFTQDNPFQSGSPDRISEFTSPARRRTTQGASLNHDKPKQKSSRRRTDGDVVNRTTSRASIKRESESDVSAGEEFTPDQQLELETALAGDRTVARRRKTKRSGAAKVGTWSVLVAVLGGAATVWRQEKLNVGYCGIGSPSTSVGGVEIPEWASTLQPQCEPCPQHAYCYANLKTVCEPGFVLTPHPLNLGGLVPLPPTCEPDGEKAKRVKAVADFAVEKELRERNAKFECGEVKQPEVKVEELKTSVASKRSRKMSDEEFDELWASALDEIMGRDEVTSRNDGVIFLRSTSLARVPLGCAIRRSLYATFRQHLPKLVGLVLLSLAAVYGNYSLTSRRSTSARAKVLAGTAMEKLALQASLHADDPAAYPEPWISMVALRDDVLREEFSATRRSKLWEVVKGLVEGNANVRSVVREGRTGEVSRVWEWIGAVQRLESPEGRRSSRRFSLGGPGFGSTPGTPTGYNIDDLRDKGEMTQVRRWTEGSNAYY